MSYIIIITLFLIYVYGITSIWGSINPLAKKTGAGKIKQAILDFGYKYSIFWTNFVGLTLSGFLQLSHIYVVSFWFSLGSVLMPICYTVAVKYFNDIKWAEYSWGFFWGCLMLAALIGG